MWIPFQAGCSAVTRCLPTSASLSLLRSVYVFAMEKAFMNLLNGICVRKHRQTDISNSLEQLPNKHEQRTLK